MKLRYWWHLESGKVKIADVRPGDGWIETTSFNYAKRRAAEQSAQAELDELGKQLAANHAKLTACSVCGGRVGAHEPGCEKNLGLC